MTDQQQPQVICVLGNWSSGTTAVTGYLGRLGANTCPPHVLTNDPSTPDSFESLAFRNACAETIDEIALQKIGSRNRFRNWMVSWINDRKGEAGGVTHIVLKHPLSAFLIPEINDACAPKWVMVTRRFQDIENTRLRRQWHPTYGAAGAHKVYSSAYGQLIEEGQSFLTVAFSEFRVKRQTREQLISHVGIAPSTAQMTAAESWVR